MKLIVGALMAVTATMGVVGGKAFVRRLAHSTRGSDKIELKDPYSAMSRAYAQNPEKFSLGIVRGAALGLKRTLPDGRVIVGDKAAVTDLGEALRIVVSYLGEIPTEDRGMAKIDGQSRMFLHAGGAVSVHTVCFTDYSMCPDLEELIQRTDAAVVQHLWDPVEAMVPPDGNCETTSAPEMGRNARVTLCRFDGDMMMAFTRMSLAETRAQLQQFIDDPEFKALNKELDGR